MVYCKIINKNSLHNFSFNDMNALVVSMQHFWYIHYLCHNGTFNHQKKLKISSKYITANRNFRKGDDFLLYLPHALLFVLSSVVLPGGHAVHTGAAVSLAAIVW